MIRCCAFAGKSLNPIFEEVKPEFRCWTAEGGGANEIEGLEDSSGVSLFRELMSFPFEDDAVSGTFAVLSGISACCIIVFAGNGEASKSGEFDCAPEAFLDLMPTTDSSSSSMTAESEYFGIISTLPWFSSSDSLSDSESVEESPRLGIGIFVRNDSGTEECGKFELVRLFLIAILLVIDESRLW